jgi:hypothetical protein
MARAGEREGWSDRHELDVAGRERDDPGGGIGAGYSTWAAESDGGYIPFFQRVSEKTLGE